MPSLDLYEPNLNTGILLQGPPGSSKTTLALQFPNPGIIDCDNNLGGPVRWLRKNNPDQIPRIIYETVNIDDKGVLVEPRVRYDRFKTLVKAMVANPAVETIIIDSATYVSDYIQGDIQRQNSRKENEFQQSDWLAYLWAWKNLCTQLRSVKGKLFILTAHERPEKDEVSGVIKYFIALPGQIRDIIGGLFSDVWHMEAEEVAGKHEFVVRTMPNGRYSLKNSFPGMPVKFKAEWKEIAKFYTTNK